MNIIQKLEKYRDQKIKLSAQLDDLKQLEKEIKQHILETGDTESSAGVSTSIKSSYTRYEWDLLMLMGYAVAHPEINEFQSETQVGPSVAIKIDKNYVGGE